MENYDGILENLKFFFFSIINFQCGYRYKNKQEIFHGLKYHFESEGPNHTLIINKLHPEDESKYICKINEAETFAYLTVEGILLNRLVFVEN